MFVFALIVQTLIIRLLKLGNVSNSELDLEYWSRTIKQNTLDFKDCLSTRFSAKRFKKKNRRLCFTNNALPTIEFVTLYLPKLTYPSPVRPSNSSLFSYVCIPIIFIFHFIYQSVHIYNNRTNYNCIMHSYFLHI